MHGAAKRFSRLGWKAARRGPGQEPGKAAEAGPEQKQGQGWKASGQGIEPGKAAGAERGPGTLLLRVVVVVGGEPDAGGHSRDLLEGDVQG